jgi:hypothetical protein
MFGCALAAPDSFALLSPVFLLSEQQIHPAAIQPQAPAPSLGQAFALPISCYQSLSVVKKFFIF